MIFRLNLARELPEWVLHCCSDRTFQEAFRGMAAAFQSPGRKALLICGVVLAGYGGCVGFTVRAAAAQDVVQPINDGISFADPALAFEREASEPSLDLSAGEGRTARFVSPEGAAVAQDSSAPNPHQYEVELTADGGFVGAPFDVSLAQRTSFGADAQGDIAREGRGAELRVGQNLSRRRESSSESDRGSSWYVFAASDDEAVTWNPGSRSEFGGQRGSGFSMQQDRVEIGDLQAGVTYDTGGLQASLAYVEREVSTRMGARSWSEDENFAGVTLTMKR